MASLRSGTRRDGSTYVQVLYRLNGKQSSTSFEDLASVHRFQRLADEFGPAKALESLGADPEYASTTVHRESRASDPPGATRVKSLGGPVNPARLHV
jgi:hypothetical protein